MTKSFETFRRKRKNENYYKLAKQKTVRARSYFKLEQLDNKFDIIVNDISIIDLGAAPGGWLEYIDSKIKTGKVIGIDLLEIKKHQDFSQNIEIIEDDFANIEEYVEKDFKFDLVLSDMAPEFSGNSAVDKGRTHKLNFATLDFCDKYLKQGGNCTFKTFEGEDLPKVRSIAQKIFKVVKEYKPHSSQKKSSETFIACFNKK